MISLIFIVLLSCSQSKMLIDNIQQNNSLTSIQKQELIKQLEEASKTCSQTGTQTPWPGSFFMLWYSHRHKSPNVQGNSSTLIHQYQWWCDWLWWYSSCREYQNGSTCRRPEHSSVFLSIQSFPTGTWFLWL